MTTTFLKTFLINSAISIILVLSRSLDFSLKTDTKEFNIYSKGISSFLLLVFAISILVSMISYLVHVFKRVLKKGEKKLD